MCKNACSGSCKCRGQGKCGGTCAGCACATARQIVAAPRLALASAGNASLLLFTDAAPQTAAAQVIRRALGIVDAQNGFTSASRGADLPVEGGELIGPNVGRLQSSGLYDFIWASQDWHPVDMFNFAEVCGLRGYVDQIADEDGEMADVYPRHCVAGTWSADFLPGVLADKIDKIYRKGTSRTKDSYSATGNPDLIPDLKARGITHVDLTGIVLRICEGLTAIKLVEAGFTVRIVLDASRDLEAASKFTWVIQKLKDLGVELVNTDDVLAGK